MSISFLQTAIDEANQTTYNFTSQSFGAADSSRRLICAVSARSSTITISSVSIGGVSATIIGQASDSAAVSGLAIAEVPMGTSGTVSVTFSDPISHCGIALHRMIGSWPTDPVDFEVDGGGADGVFDITGLANGGGIATASVSSDTTETWSGLTEDYGTTIESLTRFSGASGDFEGGEIICDFGSGNSAVGVAASWGAEPSSGGMMAWFFNGWEKVNGILRPPKLAGI